eukprot:TRINITY_DN104482_c0_g1_i1.p1 TRINITY_DN104482_c0_g1~~TRINITY_DN104482_c0_g1_i1.p1  ORF type:complete len:269 (-),score=40.77 TRINITY_DN104482_c0_g1_i1:9-815(-)
MLVTKCLRLRSSQHARRPLSLASSSAWRRTPSCRHRPCNRANATLRELWDRPLAEAPLASSSAAGAQLPLPSRENFRVQLDHLHHWRMNGVFGDKMQSTPPSASHIFASCGFFETIFLGVNAGTFSPLIFEMFMPYHLKYTALVFAWWGGTYVGLNVARYGSEAQGIWVAARALAAVVFVSAGAAGLALADGVAGMGPWPSYWLLVAGYSGMAAFDLVLFRQRMIPPWLLKWKLGISALIVASLLLGVIKGKYLEANAHKLIFEADLD